MPKGVKRTTKVGKNKRGARNVNNKRQAYRYKNKKRMVAKRAPMIETKSKTPEDFERKIPDLNRRLERPRTGLRIGRLS